MTVEIKQVADLMIAQVGDPYVFGAEARIGDPNPGRFDCSELVQWACNHLGVTMPDGAANQAAFCAEHGTGLKVTDAMDVYGTLLFRVGVSSTNHVVMCLGNHQTIEARSTALGVGRFSTDGRVWTSAARIPGVVYPSATPAPAPAAHPTLQQGATGAAVVELQRRLRIPTNGVFGTATLAAVRAFQKAHGLTVDGVVGPKTWAKLP